MILCHFNYTAIAATFQLKLTYVVVKPYSAVSHLTSFSTFTPELKVPSTYIPKIIMTLR